MFEDRGRQMGNEFLLIWCLEVLLNACALVQHLWEDWSCPEEPGVENSGKSLDIRKTLDQVNIRNYIITYLKTNTGAALWEGYSLCWKANTFPGELVTLKKSIISRWKDPWDSTGNIHIIKENVVCSLRANGSDNI